MRFVFNPTHNDDQPAIWRCFWRFLGPVFLNAGGACQTDLQRLEFLPGTELQICPVAGPVEGSQPWSFEGRVLGGSLEGSVKYDLINYNLQYIQPYPR